MRVPLLDLARQSAQTKGVAEAVQSRVQEVFASQQFILGQTVEDFEKAFCDYVGCNHAVGMSSGTDAQLAILMAMDIGPGDAVITTPYTFFATAGCIHRVGAETVFVDIRPDTMHLDPEKLRECLNERLKRDADGTLRTARGNRVRAVIPVHLFGTCFDVDLMQEIVAPFDLPIIEDAAQGIGADYPGKGGTVHAGALGESAFFSFFPTKNLGAAGDAGISVCRDEEFATRLRLVRNHGMEQRYFHRMVGGNFRIDALQAAVLHAKLPYVEQWNTGRRRNADLYRKSFTEAGLDEFITVPSEPWLSHGLKRHHTYHQYVVRADRRDDLMKHLAQVGIGHAIYYPVPLHRQECFASLGYQAGDFPEAERAAAESLALPIFPELQEAEIAAVVAAIRAFYLG